MMKRIFLKIITFPFFVVFELLYLIFKTCEEISALLFGIVNLAAIASVVLAIIGKNFKMMVPGILLFVAGNLIVAALGFLASSCEIGRDVIRAI